MSVWFGLLLRGCMILPPEKPGNIRCDQTHQGFCFDFISPFFCFIQGCTESPSFRLEVSQALQPFTAYRCFSDAKGAVNPRSLFAHSVHQLSH